jgi:hydroxypyruvate reductase
VNRRPAQFRGDALDIWNAGVEAVRSAPLVQRHLRVDGRRLWVGSEPIDLDGVDRVVVVGAGKAGAGMAAGLEAALGETLMAEKQLTGWVNVPQGCVRKLSRIHLHAARPDGVNEPTPAGVQGAIEMLRLVGGLGPADLCIALISGGGSALLPLPVDGVTLADKLAITRLLSAAGAPIDQLNVVRTQLSHIKGGGLARECRAGRMVTLIISDVLGDPLDLIASGPTLPTRATPDDALAILEHYQARQAGVSSRVFTALAHREIASPITCQVTNLVIGNNALAVEGARHRAEQLGYSAAAESAPASEPLAEQVAGRLVAAAQSMLVEGPYDCLVSGGEPTVKLVQPGIRGLGGRNQQLVLAAAGQLEAAGATRILLLSGGTDGEDGPTDAAGAWIDDGVIASARRAKLDIADYLARNDAYHWFEPLGALIRTGPTDTNVCDLRVVIVDRL